MRNVIAITSPWTTFSITTLQYLRAHQLQFLVESGAIEDLRA
jgi:hypothetical protein